MKRFNMAIKALSRTLWWASAVLLVAIAAITCLDVILRRVGFPLTFPYEVVCILAGVVIGFALPPTTLSGAHVRVEYIDTKLSPTWLIIVNAFNRLVGIGIFMLIGWSCIRLGTRLLKSGEHSAILEIPQYPLAYALAVCFFVQCLVLLHQILRKDKVKNI